MKTKTRIAASAVVVGLWLLLAASAGAVRPPDPAPTTTTTTTTTTPGPSCPTDANQPWNWSFVGVGVANYLLAPAQQVAGAGGSTVATQTLSFGASSDAFAITTQGCWQFDQQTPQSLGGYPFWLMSWTTTQSVEMDGVYLVPVNLSNPPTLVVGNDGTLHAFGAPGTDTRYDVEAPSNGSPSGALSVVGRVDLGATTYHWDPVSGHLGSFGPSPQGPTFAGQQIISGDIFLTNAVNGSCYQPSARVAAYLPLPGEFSTGPSSGPAPTGEADYNVGQPVQCGSGSGGSGGSGGGGGAGGSFSAPAGCQCAGRVHAAESVKLDSAHGRATVAKNIDLGSAQGQPIHLTVPDLYLGGLRIQNAFLDYDPSRNLWTGGGDLQLGGFALHAAPPPPNLGFGLFGDGSFDYGGAQLTLPPPGAPLFTGVNLTELGVTFALHPTVFSGDATITAAGGEVTIHGGVLVINADANEPYTYQAGALPGVDSLQTNTASNPITSFAAGISGTVVLNNVPVLGQVPLANGYVFYISPSYFEFAGNISLNLAGNAVTVTGGVNGALDINSKLYNLGGNIAVCANFPVVGSVCAQLSAIVSSDGIGACGSIGGVTVGFRYAWGDSSPDILGPFSCDLGPITVTVRPALDIGRANGAQAARPVGFDVPGGVPSTSVWLTGSSGPPRVTLTGPRGERLSNPKPGRGAESSGLVIWPEPKLNETLIAIRNPSAGHWTVTPLPGSPAVTGMSNANGLAPARITASVRGRGRALTLRYRIAQRVGQTVTFAERAGGAFHVLGTATANRGSLRFTPASGHGGRRQILATISLAGVPRQNLVVGHYTAAGPPSPITPTRVRVLRARRGLLVSWLPADRWGCLVVATLSDGHRLLYSMRPNQTSVRIAKLAPGIGARITVSDLGPTGNTSRAAVASLAADRPGPVAGAGILRIGKRLTISWRRAIGATRYIVTITVRGRTRVTLFGITSAATVTLKKEAPLLLSTGAVSRISIRGVNAAGQEGPAATTTYTPPNPNSRHVPAPFQYGSVRPAIAAVQ